MTEKYVLFDLDNCISDDSKRIHLIKDKSIHPDRRFHNYHQAHVHDLPKNIDIVHSDLRSGAIPVFITGRDEAFHSSTVYWINRHVLTGEFEGREYHLLMRPTKYHVPAPRLKQELLLRAGIPPEKILVAYDDRDDIIEMYRAMGIPAIKLFIHNDYNGVDTVTDQKEPYQTRTLSQRFDDTKKRTLSLGAELEKIAQAFPPGAQRDALNSAYRMIRQALATKPEAKAHTLADTPLAAPKPRRLVAEDEEAPHPGAMVNEWSATPPRPSILSTPAILEGMAKTFRSRNGTYGNNSEMVGRMWNVMYPDGLKVDAANAEVIHLWILVLVKMSRFVVSGHKHIDSAHDGAIYLAMIESLLSEAEKNAAR